MRAQVEPFEFGIRLKLLPFRYDQRRRKSSFAADYHHLIDEARTLDELFDRLRRDVLAAGSLEQFFFSVSDAQKSIRVETADISRLKPAIFREHCACFFGLVPVAQHDVRPASLDFAIRGDAHLDVWNRFAGGAHTIVVKLARRDHPRSFRQTATL